MLDPLHRRLCRLLVVALALAPAILAQSRAQHYALILEDSPVSGRFASRIAIRSEPARGYRQQIEARQRTLRRELAARRIQVVGSVSTLLNAIFVIAPATRLNELKSLPGVKGVVAERRYRVNLNRATQLVHAPGAWIALGGTQNAGLGMKIAILDNGIDQTHPAFQDDSLKPPAGYPICSIAYPNGVEANLPDCGAFTNNKVIVARSYVPLLAAGSDPGNPAADSRPDDYLPRDHSGHGTAVASAAAAVLNTGPSGLTFNGVAPKAFLGNYKIFGSPQINDFATDSTVILALEDALNDRMDIASLSLGAPATGGPLDSGAICGNPDGVPCDLIPQAVESAVRAGMVVVIAAGNDGGGASSYRGPALGSIETPGDSPSAITVGSSTSSHFLVEGVEVPGAPLELQHIAGWFGDGPFVSGAVAGSLVDVKEVGDGWACRPLPAESLLGAFALIERGGSCSFADKVNNAQNAGAAGVIFYLANDSGLFSPGGLSDTTIPSILISNRDAMALRSYLKANPGHTVVMDPVAIEQTKDAFNVLSLYSSLGPTTGDNALKPELVATGGSDQYFTDIYLATQSYDPLGELYSANRYSAGSGTSFATPLVAGAAALVKQVHPNYTPAQIKSALVNSADQDVISNELGDPVGVQSAGAGKLDAGSAIQATVTANPAGISFGRVTSLPDTRSFDLTNAGSSSVKLSLVVIPAGVAALDQSSLTLAEGETATVHLTLTGSLPPAGSYSGFVFVSGGAAMLRIPYLFLVGSGVVDNMILLAYPSDTTAGLDAGPIAIKLVDSNGVPVSGARVNFASSAGAKLQSSHMVTDRNGVAGTEAFLGSTPGDYNFTVSAGRMSLNFLATALRQPALAPGGVANAASFESGKPVAPGSYISLFGTDLSQTTASASTARLPLVMDHVTVSFDVPSAGLSLPGHMIFVSPNQVNVQVPWELEGQTSAQVKVTVGDGFGVSYGNVVTIPLASYAPALFDISEGAQRGQEIQLYANGLGPVNNQPASGEPATAAPLSTCKSTPEVNIGGESVSVDSCGLTAGHAGLYRVNVVVPSGLTPGPHPVTVSVGGVTSKASAIQIR
jgi:minor extracellular serine protease Vpr